MNTDPEQRKQVITQQQRFEGKLGDEHNDSRKTKTTVVLESKQPSEQRQAEEEQNIQINDRSQSGDRNEQNQQLEPFQESQKILLIFNILEGSTFSTQFGSILKEYGIKEPKKLRNKIVHSHEKGTIT